MPDGFTSRIRLFRFFRSLALISSILLGNLPGAAQTSASAYPVDPPVQVRERIDPGEDLFKTLVFPAWGSYATDSYALATAQVLIDAMGIGAIVSERVNPIKDAGAGIPTLFGLGLIVLNRLLSMPLNGFQVFLFNTSDVLAPTAPVRPERHFGAFLAGGAYADAMAMGISLQWRYARMKLLAEGAGPHEDYGWRSDAPGVYFEESLDRDHAYGLALESNLRVNNLLTLRPGFQFLAGSFVSASTTWPDTGWTPLSKNKSESFGLEILPSLAFALHPYSRLALEIGFAYAAFQPALVDRFQADMAARNPDLAREGRWRLNLQAEAFIW